MKGNMYRTYKCSELREKHVGEEIKLAGWVDTIRDLGGVLFIDLRDQYGVTQVVVSGDEEKVDFASKIPTESTISVSGKVRLRDEETINLKLETGTVELFADKIEILGKRSKDLPFEIENDRSVREDLRLEYRFLDLRNEKIHQNIKLRSKILKNFRDTMDELGFEINCQGCPVEIGTELCERYDNPFKCGEILRKHFLQKAREGGNRND